MYKITCDGHALLDTRDESLILKNPKVRLSDNAVGEASFTIYKQHPNYDKLSMLKSLFEISDEYGVIFRGRMTEHTRDIKKGKAIDLEGAMAYFNDSIVRPYVFPDDFEKQAGYISAAASGNVVEYYLAWLIEQHNAQVDGFQQFKLGTVTVRAPGNKIERNTSEYPNTFEEIKSKLFDSSLGGHLCIRYEADGNYIDYLATFTERNAQGITYGENLRDLTQTTDGKETYSAIVPRGAEIESEESTGNDYEGMYGTIVGTETVKKRITIAELFDRDITSDIVKKGDMLYSKRAVAAYGWRFVPSSESLWEDVKEAQTLLDRGVEALEGTATSVPNTIECKAVDLHCTDAEIRSFRMYRKIPVYVAPHGINSDFDITTLDIDLLNPQNTSIVAGKVVVTMTALQEKRSNEVKQLLNSYVTRTQVAEGFKVTETLLEKNSENILAQVSSTYTTKDYVEEQIANVTLTDAEIIAAVSGTYATKEDMKTEIAKVAITKNQIIAYVSEDFAKKSELNGLASTTYVKGLLALTIETGADNKKYSQLASNVNKIVFNAGQIEIKTDYFTLSPNGAVKIDSGDFGGLSITSNSLKIANDEGTLHLYTRGVPRVEATSSNDTYYATLDATGITIKKRSGDNFSGENWFHLYNGSTRYSLYLDHSTNTVKFTSLNV